MSKMMKLSMMVLMKMSCILCMNKDESDLVRMLSDRYKIDYQILFLNEGGEITNSLLNQPKFTQIVTPENIEKTVIVTSKIMKIGYFLFLQDDEKTKEILNKFDQIMFKRYIWFIKTYNKQTTFDLELGFDMDINLIYETNYGLEIYELYGLDSRRSF